MKINIYKISVLESEDYNKCYVGSTKLKINVRFTKHKSSYNRKSKFKSSVNELFEYAKEKDKKLKIEILEIIDYDNEKTLEENNKYFCLKENEYIEKLKEFVVNKRKAKR